MCELWQDGAALDRLTALAGMKNCYLSRNSHCGNVFVFSER